MELLIFIAMALGAVNAQNLHPRGDALPDAAAVTPRALIPRADIKTLAWFSVDNTYSPWEYDPATSTYTTSGQFFRRCPTTRKCNMYTACSNGVLVAAETTLSCGDRGASRTCNHHVLQTKSGDSNTLSWYFCDVPSVTGLAFYEQNPLETGAVKVPSSASASATIHGSAEAQRTTVPVATGTVDSGSAELTGAPSSGSGSKGSGNKAGVIAGSVVGVVGLLAILGGLVFIVLRRRKQKSADSDVTLVQEKFDKASS
ncbi:hypothetical protein B0J11DRAFT_262374 [Dendryphion nanum]|uniref:Uncharacterized protein n=1 Tax=Dendryphion nanum TaxID=256645 RepID=A0A9P9E4X7_9PLEO|nr:hypothetical protein B0J11DRAFT_262374 [Dendryphion nanum]